jgi:hypothetical protein
VPSRHVLIAPITRRVVPPSWRSGLHALPDAETVDKAMTLVQLLSRVVI